MSVHLHTYRYEPPVTTPLEAATRLHAEQPVTALLPSASIVPTRAENVPGKILWVDYEAARELGFHVPPDHCMTEEFHAELIAALSFKNMPAAKQFAQQPAQPKWKIVDAVATRYHEPQSGGDGRTIHVGKYAIKGAGVTSLAGWRGIEAENPGTCHLHEALITAFAGKLTSRNLMTQGGTRPLAVIDVGEKVCDSTTGEEKPQALIVSFGNSIRLAHATTDQGMSKDAQKLAAISGIASQQEMVTAMAKSHARAAAEQLRWRLLHGVQGSSNNGWYGEMIDHGYTSTQMGTAPVHGINESGLLKNKAYAHIYLHRTESRNREAVFATMGEAVLAEYKKYYAYYKNVEMLHACGMKKELAEAFVENDPELATKFRKMLMHISKFYNNGSLNISHDDTTLTSIVDIFNLLREAPLELEDGVIAADKVEEMLNPSYDDITPVAEWRKEARYPGMSRETISAIEKSRISKYHCQSSGDAKKLVKEFTQEFSKIYPQIIDKAKTIGLENGFFENEDQFIRSLQQRAEFENRPIDKLMRVNLKEQLHTIITQYQEDHDSNQIQSAIDELIADSMRNVDQILKQGEISVYDDHIEIQKATINGTHYAIRIDKNGKQHLDIGFDLKSEDNGFSLNGVAINMQEGNIPTLQIDPEEDSDDEPMILQGALDTNANRLSFSLPLEPYTFQKLRGKLLLDKDPSSHKVLPGYVFAAPDAQELDTLTSFDEHARNFRAKMKEPESPGPGETISSSQKRKREGPDIGASTHDDTPDHPNKRKQS